MNNHCVQYRTMRTVRSGETSFIIPPLCGSHSSKDKLAQSLSRTVLSFHIGDTA